jgi:class 3 adenylate cyclase
VRCTSCGTENESGRKFCGNCGAQLALTCPYCASPNAPGTRFCGECGKALSGTDAPTLPAASASPATERRMVSVLFADLVGFTTISEARDAEDVRALLDTYFEACRAIIERYGGTVEKFIGDAVMAVWGTPVAQEDDAERAVRAALDLVDAVRRLGGERHVDDLALRAAVHTGEAVVTIGAAGMGMVAGDLVNTASRLQSVATPGTVLVGEGTRRAASNAIVFEEAGDQALKGKASPIPAFKALRVVAQRGGVGRSEGLEPPFVGRDAELQLIKDFYHATARDRGPRVVSVIGQAGIGKSRLAWEFLKYIDGVTETVYWHQGRSPAYGEGISFWALGEMVRMRIGVGESTDETSTREGLTNVLNDFVADPEERRSLEGPLLHLLGIGDSTSHERGQLFIAWRTFFERIAETGPVVMVFEDLQWADEGLLDFIEELVARSRGRSIYLITLARPELLDRRPTWGAGQRSFTSLSLSPLGDDDMGVLLEGLVPGLPGSVIGQIVARAEGIPLYAVEMVRTLLNDGRIQREGDAFRPIGDLTLLAVPESLHALIAARIDALPPAERTLVQDGSVLGQSFGLPALKAVARSGPEEIEPMLHHLVQREIVALDDDPRSPERGNYRFVQGLLREVAYGTLARDDRRTRHLAAARYYETLGDDELSGVLAQHYVDAYQAHPDGPEGAAVAAQARVALRGAAQRAADLGSRRLALGYIESALVVVTDPAEELDLRAAASDMAAGAGLMDASVRHGERAVALATDLGDVRARRIASAHLGDMLLEGHHDRALEILTAAYEEPGLTPGDPGYLQVAAAFAKAMMRSQNDARAVEVADAALRAGVARAHAGEREDMEWSLLDLLVTRGTSLSNINRVTEAIVMLTGALEVARRKAMYGMVNRALINLTYALAPDDPARGFQVARDAIDETKKWGHIWGLRYVLGNAVEAGIDVGEWDWVIEVLADQELDGAEPAERIWFGAFQTFIRALRGEETEAAAREIYAESRSFDDPQYLMLGTYALIGTFLAADRLPEAVRLADEIMTTGGPVGSDCAVYGARAAIWQGDVIAARRMRTAHEVATVGRRTTAMRETMDGGIAMLEGRAVDARTHYLEALRIWRELGLPYWVALCDLDIVVTGALEPAERRRAADEGRGILAALGAQPLIDRLDAALAAESVSAATTARPEAAKIGQEA